VHHCLHIVPISTTAYDTHTHTHTHDQVEARRDEVQAELRREEGAVAALVSRAAAAGREADNTHADAARWREEATALAARVQVTLLPLPGWEECFLFLLLPLSSVLLIRPQWIVATVIIPFSSTSSPSFPCKAHHAEEAAARRAVDACRDEERRLREEVVAMRADPI
jgi:hypothetical protein